MSFCNQLDKNLNKIEECEKEEKLEKILKYIGVIDWDISDSHLSEYLCVRGCMSKIDLEKLINKTVKPVEEFDEEDVYPLALYIKGNEDDALFVGYEEGEEGHNVHLKLPNETLTPELQTLVILLKEL